MKTYAELRDFTLNWNIIGARKRGLASIASDGVGTVARPWTDSDVKRIWLTADGELQVETQYTGFKDEAWLRDNDRFADEIIAALRACHAAAQQARKEATRAEVARMLELLLGSVFVRPDTMTMYGTGRVVSGIRVTSSQQLATFIPDGPDQANHVLAVIRSGCEEAEDHAHD